MAEARNYGQRCATCRHNVWQNEAVGDCRIFRKDVLHDNVEPCPHWQGKDRPGRTPGAAHLSRALCRYNWVGKRSVETDSKAK